jgi:hypothetical protein
MDKAAISSPFVQELRMGHHALMTECAAAAERLLGHNRPAGSPAPRQREQEEAVRMAGLFARLGDGFGRAALLRPAFPPLHSIRLRRVPQRPSPPPPCQPPSSTPPPARPAAGSRTATPPAIT